jgi:hypothetical protein
MNEEVVGICSSHLKSHQIILEITASCNKRMKRINTLIISSMKILTLRAPFIGRLMEGSTEAPSLYLSSSSCRISFDKIRLKLLE